MELSSGLISATGLLSGALWEGTNMISTADLAGAEQLTGGRFFSGLLLAAGEPSFLAWLGEKIWIYTAVALGVGLVIFVHELGHFLAAKLFGVKVEKFYVGFDVPISLFGIRLPRSFGRFRWGETEYGIGVIPLGGYVKMLGQDDDPRQAAAERERIRLANGNSEEAEEGIDAPAATLDPRSYPAKTVWQRMVIISAGVVMNLITSVLFAAIAFGFGVKYQPAVIGQTVPGYPAWEAGLEPGGRIVSAGGIENDPKLHFMDMTTEILKASIDEPDQPVAVVVQYGDELVEKKLMTRETTDKPKRRLIGIGPPIAAKLNDQLVALPNSMAEAALSAESRGSEILAIDGKDLEKNEVVGATLADAVYRMFVVKRDQPVTLTLANEDGTTEVTLQPQPLKTMGLSFSPGAVAALVQGGPADTAGVRVGDRIVGLGADGAPVDAVSLPGKVVASEGSVLFRLQRGTGADVETVDISVTPKETYSASAPFAGSSGQVELASLGMTYLPEAIVVAADPEVTSLEVGDQLKRVVVEWGDVETAKLFGEVFGEGTLEKLTKGWEISNENSLVSLIEVLQSLPPGTKVDLRALRGERQTVVEARSLVTESEEFWYERGLVLSVVMLVHKADSLGEAFSLGLRESKRKLGEVVGFLRMIFTGRVSASNIGGPGAIVFMAGSAASVGITKLLLFLTLLSVNLAVLNFLPIPALDGGHMVFLIAEAVRGKPVDEELQAKLTMAGVLALLSLMAFVIINDYLNISSMM